MIADKSSQKHMEVILYPRFGEIQESIRQFHDIAKAYGEPKGLVLEGLPRTGKTWLVRNYSEQFPHEEIEEGLKMPVLYLEMPFPTTIERVIVRMFVALGSHFYRMSSTSPDALLADFIKTSQVELIILDNFDVLTENPGAKVDWKVLNWLLAFMKDTQVSFLLVCTEGKADLLASHPRLSYHFATPLKLTPFEWNTSNGYSSFANVVQKAEKVIGVELPWQSESDKDLLFRVHYATDGIIGNLMNLLQHAAGIAHKQDKTQLDFNTLSIAFDTWRPIYLSAKVNPFHPSFGEIFLPPQEASIGKEKDARRNVDFKKRKPSQVSHSL